MLDLQGTRSQDQRVLHAIPVDRPDHLLLFRTYVSRNAAGKEKAVLEGVGLDSSTIEACFRSNPLDDEGAVQAGLIKWKDGSCQVFPSKWKVLISAMEFAGVAKQHIAGLKVELRAKRVARGKILACGWLACMACACDVAVFKCGEAHTIPPPPLSLLAHSTEPTPHSSTHSCSEYSNSS